jgi:hypothetical protein
LNSGGFAASACALPVNNSIKIGKGGLLNMAAEKKADAEKPLDKMTVKELKEIGLSIPELKGVHGMNKQDLLIAIKKARGIEDSPKKTASTSVKVLKQKINSLKSQHQAVLEAKDARMAKIYQRRISRLKKKTRKA